MTRKNLTKEQGRQLVGLLQHQRDSAEESGEMVESYRYAAAADAISRWLDGEPYPSIVAEYAYLLDGAAADGAAAEGVAVGETTEPLITAETPPATEQPSSAPVESIAPEEAAAPEESAASEEVDIPEEVAAASASEEPAPPAEPPIPDTAAEPMTAEESFVIQEAQKELARIRADFNEAGDDPGSLNLVRSRIQALQRNPKAPPDAEIVAGQIRTRINSLILDAHKRGSSYQAEGKIDDARREYALIFMLDKDDDTARSVLDRIDREDILRRAESGGNALLRQSLAERRNIEKLDAAVREAELLQLEGRLPVELISAAAEARQAFDALRRGQGEMTTMARLGDLGARKKAYQDLIKQHIDGGIGTVYDAGRNQFVPIAQAVEEARIYYQDKSDDAASHEMVIIDRAEQLGHPAGALALLREAMATRPPDEGEKGEQYIRGFTSDTVAKWFKPREQELEQLVRSFHQAEAKDAEAAKMADPLKRLSLLREAQALYPRLSLLNEKIAQERVAASNDLAVTIREYHNLAREFIADGFRVRPDDAPQDSWYKPFDDARSAIGEADRALARWVDGERPPELVVLATAGGILRGEIQEARTTRREFDRREARIRKEMLDPDRRHAARQLFDDTEKLIADKPEYAPLQSELRRLSIFVSQHKDISDQLSDARQHKEKDEWEEVARVARQIIESGQAGSATGEVNALLAQAERELNITAIQEAVEERRFADAEKKIASLLVTAGEDQPEIQRRLEHEITTIKAAKENTTMAEIYEIANKQAAQPLLTARLDALRRFRHVAGEGGGDEGWPPFAPSFQTTDAARRATELRKELRDEYLRDISDTAQKVREGVALDDKKAAAVADTAHLLREAALFDTHAERSAADELVLYQGRADARDHEQHGRWLKAVQIWERLDRVFEREVADDLRRARIRKITVEVDELIHTGKSDQALEALRDPEINETIGDTWELRLLEADAHAGSGDYGAAADVARRVAARFATGSDEVAIKQAVDDKLRWIQREQSIVRALNKANDQRSNRRYKDAVATLYNAAQDTLVADSHRLRDLRETITREATDYLIGEAEQLQGKNSQEGKTQAIICLAELDEIEKLANVAEEQRQADKRLRPLKNDLPPSVAGTLNEAYSFKPTADALDRSIERAVDLSSRLQSFRRISTVLNVDLGSLRQELEEEGPRMGATVDKLQQLRELLNEVDDTQPNAGSARTIWDNAVVSGNFAPLEIFRGRIIGTGLTESLDAQAFLQRLEEWTVIRAHVMERIGDIFYSFTNGASYQGIDGHTEEKVEDFSGVLRHLRALRQMPPLRPDRRAPWQQLDQAGYDRILGQMGPLLDISHIASGDRLQGWAQVEQAAETRLEEVNAWVGWEQAFTRLVNQAGVQVQGALDSEKLTGVTRMEQRAAWEAAESALSEALAMLDTPVTRDDGTPIAVQTRWAELITERAAEARQNTSDWLARAQGKLAGSANLSFPLATDFSAASRTSYEALATLLTRAREIGTSNDAEKKLLDHYQTVLATLAADNKPRGLRALFWRNR